MDLLTAGVMNGMIGASSNIKMADVSMGIYRQAKTEGDTAKMKRSLGYANDSMSSAKEDSQEAQKSMEEAQIEAKEQAKAEQQANLDKKAQEAAQAQKALRQAAIVGKTVQTTQTQQTAGNSVHADTVEISNEGKAAAQEDVQAAVGTDINPQANIDFPEQSANASLPEAKIYTPKGDVKPANVKVKLSVSV